MINRGINASAGMLIINPNARNSSRIGLSNEKLQRGSIHYVGSEIRSIILSKMMVDPQDDICVIGGESIYRQLLPYCDTAHVTKIDYAYEADTYFPNLDKLPEWKVTASSGEKTYYDLEF